MASRPDKQTKKALKAEKKRAKAAMKAAAKADKKAGKRKNETLESRIAAEERTTKGKRLAARAARRKAKDVLGLLGWKKIFSDGLCIVEDGVYSETIRFSDVSYQSARDDRQDAIFDTLCTLVNYFGSDVHVQYTVVNSPIAESQIGSRRFVDVAPDNPMAGYADEYNEILNAKMREGVSNISRGLFISYSVEEADINRAVQSLAHVRTQIISSLASISSRAHKLDGQERLELIWSLLHPYEEPSFDLERDITHGNGLLTDKDLVAPMGIDFKPDEQGLMDTLIHPKARFRMGDGTWCQVLCVKSFGSELSDNAVSSIIDLPIPMAMTWHIHGWDKGESIRKVRNADAWIDKEIMTEQRKAAKQGIDTGLITPSLKHRKDETEELLDQILGNNQRIYEYTGLVYVHAKSAEKLSDAAQQVVRTARQSSLTVKRLPFMQKEAVNSILPLASNHVDVKRTLTTAQVAIMVPFATQELNDAGGIYMGQNKVSHNLVMENRKELPSPMGFVSGTPGSGKSFTVKQEMSGIIMATSASKTAKMTYCPSCSMPLHGATENCPACGEALYTDQIFIIDPACEYPPITEAAGGAHHDMSPDTQTFINVFDRSDVADMGNQSQLAFKTDALLAMTAASMGEGNEGLPDAEKSVISRVVELCYRQADLAGGPDPTLEDFYQIMLQQPEPEARDIALRFERYVSGSLSFFANHSNIDMGNRIVDISFRDLAESARAFGMVCVMEAIRNRMYANFARGITTWLFIDEVQSMFSHPTLIDYFARFWREGRKFNAICTGITQNTTRMLQHPEAADLVHNSDHIMLLKQSPVDRAMWAQLLELSPQEIGYIGNDCAAGDGLLISGGAHVPIEGNFPKGKLYDLLSTKASEVAERNRSARFEAARKGRESGKKTRPSVDTASSSRASDAAKHTEYVNPKAPDGWATPVATILGRVEHGDTWSARLADGGIVRVADLRGKTRRDLVALDGIGPGAVKGLERALADAGFGKVIE